MMKNKFKLILGLLLLMTLGKTFGQEAIPRKHYLDQLLTRNELKKLLRNSMNNYFDPASYILDLQIEFVDAMPENHHWPKMDDDILIAELPGIPFARIPRLSESEIDLSFSENTNPGVIRVIERIHLTIYADNNYETGHLNFMRMLAAMVLQVNTDEEDDINVFQMAMPGLSLLEGGLKQPDEPDHVPEADISSDPIMIEEPRGSPDKNTAESQLPGIIWLAAVIFTAILMIMLLTLYWNKRRKYTREESHLSHTESDKRPSPLREETAGASEDTLMISAAEVKGDKTIQKDHQFVMTCFLEHTNDLALLFENWIDQNEQEGVKKIARIINMLDSRYLKLFRGIVSEYSYSGIEEAMTDPDNRGIETDNKLIGQLADELRRFLYAGTSKGIRAFRFLDHMDDDTLFDLCKKLHPTELSILLDNLSDERASRVIARIGPDTMADVIEKNARKNLVDFREVSCLADKCFAYFQDQQARKDYNPLRLGRIVKLLEELNIEKQEELLNSIRRDEPGLHQTIHDMMLTWGKLAELESQVLKTALAGTDSRTLAFAWADEDGAMNEKMLALRSKREQLLIQDLMYEARSSQAAEREKAKQAVLSAVRKHVKSGMAYPHTSLHV